MTKTIEEIKTELTNIMIDLRSVEFNCSFAKAATHLDYALKELKSTEKNNPEQKKEVIEKSSDAPEESLDDQEENEVNPNDDYTISEAGGSNPADDANFGLKPAK